MSDIPFADDAQWAELPFSPFREDPDTGRPPNGIQPLYEFNRGAKFADTEGRVFVFVGQGPVQGACVVTDGEHFAQFDLTSLFRVADDSEQRKYDERVEERREDERAEALSAAGADVVAALRRLYYLNDGDEAAVGELMYEIDKAARRTWQEVRHEPECWVFLRGNLTEGFRAFGPYTDFDEAAEAHDFDEGWALRATPRTEED